jgi:hypothetical protein
LAAVLVAVTPVGGEEDLTVAEEPLTGPVRDHQLALLGRVALAQDPNLGALKLNLGVSVHNGQASLWGTVPSVEVGKRAETVVRRVRGINGVQADYQVLPADDPMAEFLRRRPSGNGSSLPAPELVREPSATLTGRSGEWASGSSPLLKPLDLELPAAVSLQPPVPVTLGRPVAFPDPPLVSELGQAVDRLVRGNPRYLGVQPVIDGGIVRLQGSISRSEDVYTLAQEVSHLAGVERVIVENVRPRRP